MDDIKWEHEEGEFTHTGGRGETVIDYALGGREIIDKIEKLEIPVIIWIKGKNKKEKRRKEEKREKRRERWDEERRERFRKEMGKVGRGEGKGMGTIDQIYVLNIINRQLIRKGGKMVIIFIDMKAAFDSINRQKLVEAMRERGIREGLVKRMEEMMEKTKK